jgi:hypothetical protein
MHRTKGWKSNLRNILICYGKEVAGKKDSKGK